MTTMTSRQSEMKSCKYSAVFKHHSSKVLSKKVLTLAFLCSIAPIIHGVLPVVSFAADKSAKPAKPAKPATPAKIRNSPLRGHRNPLIAYLKT